MMDVGPGGGDGRRRGKKNRGRQGRRKRPKNRGHRPQSSLDKFPVESPFGDDRSVLAGRMPRAAERRVQHQVNGPPDAFGLFCAYYLGITASEGYQKPQLEEVARRYGMTPKEVRDLLGEHGLDEESMRKVDFDLEGAQLDIRLAPEGISRIEVARDLWQDYLQAKGGE